MDFDLWSGRSMFGSRIIVMLNSLHGHGNDTARFYALRLVDMFAMPGRNTLAYQLCID